jgi:hypothetical protein
MRKGSRAMQNREMMPLQVRKPCLRNKLKRRLDPSKHDFLTREMLGHISHRDLGRAFWQGCTAAQDSPRNRFGT